MPALLQQLLPVLLLLLLLLHHGGSRTAAALPVEAGSIDPAEVQARAQKLLAENLQPTLDYWHRLAAARGGRKLTMQHFFKTWAKLQFVRANHVVCWGVLNGRVVQLNREGEVRYSAEAMIKEKRPNLGAAESLKRSMWLAIEDGIARGVRFPDVLFLYNVADGPLCNLRAGIPCHDGTYAPPLSIMSLDPNIVSPKDSSDYATYYADILVPLFRNMGYSRHTAVGGPGPPHHPKIYERAGGPQWSIKNSVRPSVEWSRKTPKLFFRGSNYCPHLRLPVCPRAHLANMSLHFPDKLDIACGGLGSKYTEEMREHGMGSGPRRSSMAKWPEMKYLANVDGLAGSSRLLPLLHMGSVVVKQHRSPNVEWYFNSIKPEVHFTEIFRPSTPGGPQNFNDALDVVDRLRADDAAAEQLAQRGLEFAQTYLVKDVMLAYLKGLLDAYKDLFEDMDEYIAKFGDPGNPMHFDAHTRDWERDWRTVVA